VQQEVDVVEAKPPVLVPPARNEGDAASLAKELKADGRVVLRSVGFSEGRPTLLPGSEPAVKAIADLLARDPALKLHVVVHTDDSAPSGQSMDLAKKRAAAIVSLLKSRYRIPSSRVQAAGVGPLAPVANNATAEGRALNRRVELVPMGGGRGAGQTAGVRR
jgi:outer membrane protein OmpA-like peptidoglycan-associated protein